MSPTKNKLNKKSKMPFNINRKSILGVLSLVYQEIIDSFLTKTKIKKPKELEVLELVKKKAIKNRCTKEFSKIFLNSIKITCQKFKRILYTF